MDKLFRSAISPLGVTLCSVACMLAATMVVVAPANAQNADSCDAPRSTGRSIGRSILGRVIGDVAGRASNSLGYAARFVPSAEVADTLTDAIACRLDTQEQVKAKDATIEATRGERVGTSVGWTSETRANVSGRSTVVAREDAPAGQPAGTRCMMIDDVILVNGQETVQQKRMCRVPPSPRYALAA